MTSPHTLPPPALRKRTVHGVTVGIMILDTGFKRFPGDVGYAPTFDFPVQYAVAKGATPIRVVKPNADNMLDLFLRAIDDLVALGVDGISTSCGFLSILHKELVAYSPVPVATSALLQVPMINSVLPKGKRAGIITADKAALTADHLAAVNCPLDTPVVGFLDGSQVRRNHREANPNSDRAIHEAEIVELGERLVRQHPDVGAIVMECTNFPPFSAAVEQRTGLPVFNIITMINWFQSGLRPRDWSLPGL